MVYSTVRSRPAFGSPRWISRMSNRMMPPAGHAGASSSRLYSSPTAIGQRLPDCLIASPNLALRASRCEPGQNCVPSPSLAMSTSGQNTLNRRWSGSFEAMRWCVSDASAWKPCARAPRRLTIVPVITIFGRLSLGGTSPRPSGMPVLSGCSGSECSSSMIGVTRATAASQTAEQALSELGSRRSQRALRSDTLTSVMCDCAARESFPF
mmetsp:Transcript_32504/g.80678  ORF Transcript_32504/g.80678 Transcript_32504/m.80678 type:complete len:209 (-) Transcript_32504:321-947(-)